MKRISDCVDTLLFNDLRADLRSKLYESLGLELGNQVVTLLWGNLQELLCDSLEKNIARTVRRKIVR